MPLWRQLTFFYFILAALTMAAIWYFEYGWLAKIVTTPDFFDLSITLSLLTAALLLVAALLFSAIGHFMIRPMEQIAAAMRAYAADGTHASIEVPKSAPREVRALIDAFGEMAEGIEVAHTRDAEISRVKSDFISTAAHQLRTPLTGVRWALEALENAKLDEEQLALVKNASEKSRELVNIVKTLLDTTAIESGKYKYDFANLDIGALAQNVVDDFKHVAAEKNVSISYTQDKQHAYHARADVDRIKWVLNNLVENAIRYTPAGGTVTLAIELMKDKLLLHVRDTGIGIPEGEKGNIFERFYRAQNAIAKENEGNGLGLYIAHQIAVDHGGSLSFANNPDGPGTTFTLTLLPMS